MAFFALRDVGWYTPSTDILKHRGGIELLDRARCSKRARGTMLHHRPTAILLSLAVLLSSVSLPARAAEPQSSFDRLLTMFQFAIVLRKPIPFHLARGFCAHTTELDRPATEIARKKLMLSCLRELSQKLTIDKPDRMSLFLY